MVILDIFLHISQVKVILACLLTIEAVPDWINELSGLAFFIFFFDLFGVPSSVDLEDDDLDDIMNNNNNNSGQCPVSLSPIS